MVEQNAKMTAEIKEQAAQSARQAQSMAVLAYDAKRDSEVMKAITVVTLIFLPATFVCVSPIPRLEWTIYPLLLSRRSSAWVSSVLIRAGSRSPTKVVLSQLCSSAHPCRPRSIIYVDMVDGEGKKEERPVDYSAGGVLAQAADTLRLGASGRKEGA
jgi:hypothetical protein